jgi:uncharacterized caspase-like protein
MRRLVGPFLFFFALLTGQSPLLADAKVALVIGNSAYQNASPLANPANDADSMAAVLTGLGFKVTKGTDLDKVGFDRTLSEFASSLPGAKLAAFFYAGHGLQVGGANYLLPVDAKLASASALDFEAVRLDLIQRNMERETDTNILFIDACRDNPLSRNLARSLGTRSAEIGRGLAAQESGSGTLIRFSTQPGNVALDGSGTNSPFAAALVKNLPGSGQDISEILITVRNEVMQATANRQVPWEHSALRSRVFFSQPAEGDNKATAGPAETTTALEPDPSASRGGATQVQAGLKKIVYLLDGKFRLKVTDAQAATSCTFQYDPGATGRFTGSEYLAVDEWVDVTLDSKNYRFNLADVNETTCTLEVSER